MATYEGPKATIDADVNGIVSVTITAPCHMWRQGKDALVEYFKYLVNLPPAFFEREQR